MKIANNEQQITNNKIRIDNWQINKKNLIGDNEINNNKSQITNLLTNT